MGSVSKYRGGMRRKEVSSHVHKDEGEKDEMKRKPNEMPMRVIKPVFSVFRRLSRGGGGLGAISARR